VYGPKHIFARHWRLILLVIVIAVIFWIFYVLRSILFPFLIGLLLAYILLPLVSWIEERLPQRERWLRFNRVLAIVIIYALFIGIVGVFFLYLFTIIFNTLANLIANASNITSSASDVVQAWLKEFFKNIPTPMQDQVNRILEEATNELSNTLRSIIAQGFAFLPATIGFIIGLVTLPFFLFLILLDWVKIRDDFYSAFSPPLSEYVRNVITIIGDAMRQYFRGQLILSVIVGLADFAGLTLLGIGFSPALGFLGALGEFVPIIGPWLNGIIGTIVTLATAPEKTPWVIILYISIQLIDIVLLVPRIQGNLMHIHPAVVLVVLVVGGHLAGFWGIFLALPITATVVRIYDYLRHVTAIQDAKDRTGSI